MQNKRYSTNLLRNVYRNKNSRMKWEYLGFVSESELEEINDHNFSKERDYYSINDICYYLVVKCSNCGYRTIDLKGYCPKCGKISEGMI